MTTVKKSKFILLVVLLAIMALSVTGALKVNDKTVSAANEEYSISKVEKAQLRLTAEGGLRFRFTVDAATRKNIIDNENVKIQFIIAPEKYFASGVAEDNGLKVFLNDESNNIYASTSEGVYYVNGCIQNVNVKNVALDFQCMARIVEVGEDGQTVAAVKASALSDARNLYDVVNKTVLLENDSSASAILDEASTPYSTWFGTDTYPVCVETQGEYEILKNKCAAEGNTSFANVAVAVADEITFGESDFPETNKPSVDKMYTVTFMNGSDVYATVKVKNGKNAAEPAINPRKPSDNAFSYTFSGWNGNYSSVSEDITVTAEYTSALIFDDQAALSEIAEWEKAGAVNLGSALNSSESVYNFGTNNVYKVKKTDNSSVATPAITPSDYKTLYLAYMTTKKVGLAHSGGGNQNSANTWYFVKYEKQSDGSWNLSVKTIGEDWTQLETQMNSGTNKPAHLYAGASFATMFNTYIWDADKTLDMYATDVWGVSIVDAEIAEWEKAGAINLGSALNSSESVYNFGTNNVYKVTKPDNNSVATLAITPSDYKTLYLAYMTTKKVGLAHSGGGNQNSANTWYFVKYEKQSDGSWNLSVKTIGGNWTQLETQMNSNTNKPAHLYAGASFATMFNTYIWDADKILDMYASDVWGVVDLPYKNVEIQINALPEAVSSAEEIKQTVNVYYAYEDLDDEQKAKISSTAIEKLNSCFAQAFVSELNFVKAGDVTKVSDSAMNKDSEKSGSYGAYDIYKMSGISGYGGTSIGYGCDMNNYSELYFAIKIPTNVTIFSGTNTPNIAANKWHIVKLVKGAEHWEVFAKALGEENYTSITLDNYSSLKISGQVWFSGEFKTVRWTNKADVYDVYTTGLWAK